MKVLLCDKVSQVCGDILKRNTIKVFYSETKETLMQHVETADIMVVRSATKINPDLLDKAPKLKMVVRAGTGYDNVDVEECSKRGILVMNTPMANTTSAAEHTCGLIMALSRNIPQAAKSMSEGRWDRKKYIGSELSGKTLGILGLGRIGREVATRMQAFGMKTIGYDPIVSEADALASKITKMTLEEVYHQSDYLSVHTPLLPQTKHMINEKSLNICRKGVKVVNCARGGIIDESSLLAALESGQCGGAALDVFEEEPPKNLSLAQHEKVICTPHLGASTNEAQARCGIDAANQIVEFIQGTSFTGAVNGFSVMNALNLSTKPWICLALNLGMIIEKYIKTLKVDSFQDIKLKLHLKGCGLVKSKLSIMDAFCAGVLNSKYKAANLVNSKSFTEESKLNVDIDYEESSSPELEVVMHFKNEAVWKLCGTCQGQYPVLTHIGKSVLISPPTLKGFLTLFQFNGNSETFMKIAQNLGESTLQVSSIFMPHPNGTQNWGVIVSCEEIDVSNWKNGFKMCLSVITKLISEALPLQMCQ